MPTHEHRRGKAAPIRGHIVHNTEMAASVMAPNRNPKRRQATLRNQAIDMKEFRKTDPHVAANGNARELKGGMSGP